MRLNETLSGLLLLLLGIVVAISAARFPVVPGQGVGPGFFPMLVGLGLALGGAVLMGTARKQRGLAWIELDDGLRRPRMVLNGVLVVGALIFYALVVDTVGFFLTSFVILTVLFLAFGVGRRWIAPLSVSVTLGLHVAFYTLLRVPLPWGWLEGIAW